MAVTRAEVIEKVTALVNSRYAGDWRRAFDDAAGDDRRLDHAELVSILAQAGVGYRLTRSLIASQVMMMLDADSDGFIEYAEFRTTLGETSGPVFR